MSQLKLLAITAALTLLIWASADWLLVATGNLRVHVAVEPAAGSPMKVNTSGDSLPEFAVVVTGQRRRIEETSAMSPLRVRLPIAEQEVGIHNLDVKTALDDLPDALPGLLVKSVNPPHLTVEVDQELTVSLPVEVAAGGLDFQNGPFVEPAEVHAAVSQLAWSRVADADQRIVVIAERFLKGAAEGAPFSQAVPLERTVAGVPARFTPDSISLTGTLRERRSPLTVTAVPIWVAGSPELLTRYDVVINDPNPLLTQTIEVRGPVAAIERLRRGEDKITGLILVTSDDAVEADKVRDRRPVFLLPSEVELAHDPSPVEFRLVPRVAGPAEERPD